MPPIDRGILLGRLCRSKIESKTDHQRFWQRNRNPLMEKREQQDQQPPTQHWLTARILEGGGEGQPTYRRVIPWRRKISIQVQRDTGASDLLFCPLTPHQTKGDGRFTCGAESSTCQPQSNRELKGGQNVHSAPTAEVVMEGARGLRTTASIPTDGDGYPVLISQSRH